MIAGSPSSGSITKWNDFKDHWINPGVTLPDAARIAQGFLSAADSSGTTDNFTKYLAKAAGRASTYANDKDWPAPGGQGAKGSDGVAAALKGTAELASAYIEGSFARSSLRDGPVDNGGGAGRAHGRDRRKAVGRRPSPARADDLTLVMD